MLRPLPNHGTQRLPNDDDQIVKYRCNGGHLEFSGTIWPDMCDLVTE